jgi:membrane associated rhomboid family serine protease
MTDRMSSRKSTEHASLAHSTNASVELAHVPDGTTRVVEVVLLAAAAAMALSLGAQHSTGGLRWLAQAGTLVAAGVVFYSIFTGVRLRQAGPAKLRFEPGSMHVLGPDGRSHLSIDYQRILSFERLPWFRKGSNLYTLGRPPLTIPDSLLVSQSGAANLSRELRERVGSLPGGSERLRAMSAREEAGARIFHRAPWLSLGLVAVLTLVFGVQVWIAATEPERALLLGASSGTRLLQGEVTRLLSPALLHADLLHLAGNVGLILVFGALFEGFVGRARTVLLLGLPSAVGILASSLSNPAVITVGASAGALGLFGGWIMMNLTGRNELPSLLRIPNATLFMILAWLLVGELWGWHEIDHVAHAASLLAGGTLYWLMARGRGLADWHSTPSFVTRLAWGVSVSYVLVLGWVLHAAWSLPTLAP